MRRNLIVAAALSLPLPAAAPLLTGPNWEKSVSAFQQADNRMGRAEAEMRDARLQYDVASALLAKECKGTVQQDAKTRAVGCISKK